MFITPRQLGPRMIIPLSCARRFISSCMAALRPRLTEAGRQHYRRLYPLLHTAAQRLQRGPGGNGNNYQIHPLGQLLHRVIAPEALHRVVVGIDWVNLPRIPLFPQIPQRPAANLYRAAGRAVNGDRLRLENRVKRSLHFVSLLSDDRPQCNGKIRTAVVAPHTAHTCLRMYYHRLSLKIALKYLLWTKGRAEAASLASLQVYIGNIPCFHHIHTPRFSSCSCSCAQRYPVRSALTFISWKAAGTLAATDSSKKRRPMSRKK